MKLQIRLILSLIVALSMLGCTPRPCKVPPVNQMQACLEIRRQLIFLNVNDPTLQQYQYTAGNWNPPTRQAQLIRKYREFHCDDVLRECSPCGIYNNALARPCR